MFIENHQIQLLYENARQLLNLVKATFDSTSFDDQWDSTDCTQHLSNAVELQCQWSLAKKPLGNKAISTEIKLAAFLKVYLLNLAV